MILKTLTDFCRSRLVLKTGSLTAATVIAQGLAALGFVITARWYSQADFGHYSVFLSFASMAAAVNLLAFESAVPNVRDREIGALCAGILLLLVIATVVIGVGFSLAGYSQALLLAVYTAGVGLGKFNDMCAVRERKMRYVVLARVLPPLMFLALLGWIRAAGRDGLDELYRITAAALVTPQLFILPVFLTGYFKEWPKWTEIVGMMERFKKNAFLIAPADLLSSAAHSLPIVIVERAFGPAMAAQYSVVFRFCLGPVITVGQAISNVYHADAAHMMREGREEGFFHYRRVLKALAAAGCMTWAAIALIFPFMMRQLLGPGWGTAELFLQWLAPLFGITMVTMPLTALFYVFERQGIILVNQFSYLAVALIAFGLGVHANSLLLGVALFSGFSFLRHTAILWTIDRVARHHFKRDVGTGMKAA